MQAPEELLAAQNLVLEMIAAGSPLEEILYAVQSFIGRLEPDGVCGIFLLDPDGRTLQLGAPPVNPSRFPGPGLRKTIGPGNGACGMSASRRERIIVPDAATDPAYANLRDLVRRYGLRSCWATPLLSADGAALGAIGMYYDRPHIPSALEIGAVERATSLVRIALQRSGFKAGLEVGKDRLQALIENTSDVISILDRAGIIQYVSPSVERVLGFHPSEMIGASGFACFHPDDLSRAHRAFDRALEQPGACLPIEQRFRHKDGTWRALETVANNQLADPAIKGVIVTGHDVTDRRLTEQELISTQNRYYELFENANDLIYIHDLAGTLTSFNKAAERLTGYSRAEALGKDIADFTAPEFRSLQQEMLDRMIGGEARTTYEVVFIAKNGARILLEITTRLIFEMGRPISVQGVARDITRRRDLEAHLLQTQKMEAVGRLAGGVAHDFNNMLTVITGYAEWMIEQIPPGSPLAEQASEVLLAANRAAALTNQLLAFSRKQIIQPVTLDLCDLVARLDPMLRRLIGDDVELIVATSLESSLIRADPGQMEQVVLNLVVNARDAMPDGGKLTIETANINNGGGLLNAYAECAPGDYVMLAVGDTGCGISDEIKAHIFEPFFTTKELGKGTGLGLSTVYGIVKQEGGCIVVDSQPQAGTVFRIYLPRAAGIAPLAVVPSGRGSRGTETILLVEDDASVRRTVGEMLRRLGYRVLAFPAPSQALSFVAESNEPIHLLMTDVVMPKVGGPELARQLKARRGDLKVLFMSGHAGESKVNEHLARPGSGYLQKPFTQDALAARIRELLVSSPAIAPVGLDLPQET